MLPKLPHNLRTAKRLQDSFGGLDRRPGAVNGAMRDLINMTSDHAPMLASRPYDKVRAHSPEGGQAAAAHRGMLSAGALWEAVTLQPIGGADVTKLYRDGAEIPGVTLTDTDKVMCALGERVIIWPDRIEYDARTDPDTGQPVGLKQLESSVTAAGLTFGDGTYNGEEAEMNTVTHPSASFRWEDHFKVGDAVEIAGCTAEPRNNKTPIIREMDGNKLIFYENTFYCPGDETAELQGLNGAEEEYTSPGSGTGSDSGTGTGSGSGTGSGAGAEPPAGSSAPRSVTEAGSVTLARSCPDLDYMCTNENRVWGCKGDTVWCSKLGDPSNWYVFDGVATDSWSVETGTAGSFTACASFLGYPCFFKEDKVFKVYGSRPQNFELLAGSDVGVKAGCSGSLAIAAGALIYLSPQGFVSWSGGMPSPIDAPLGDLNVTTAVGGSDGEKYWASLGPGSEWESALLCFDPRRGMWHREDSDFYPATSAVRHGSALIIANRVYMRLKGTWAVTQTDSRWYTEDRFDSAAVFADFDGKSFDSKYPVRLWLRAEGHEPEPDNGAPAKVPAFAGRGETGVMSDAAAEGGAEGYEDRLDDDYPTTLTVYISYDGGEWEQAAQYVPGRKKQSYFPVPVRRCGHWALAIDADGPWKLWAMEQEFYAGTESRRG